MSSSGGSTAWSSLAKRFDGFDARVDAVADHWRGKPAADRFFYTLSELGNWSLVWHLAGLARSARRQRGIRDAVELSACLAVESLVVNQGVKRLFRRPRPTHHGERPHSLRSPVTSSFPSGHASAAVTAAWLLSDGSSRRGRAGWGLLAALMAWSRVHVRIHHASDVAGGVATGMVLGPLLRAAARASRPD